MKFFYEYRTPDNAKHTGTVCAPDRDAAYAVLKRNGVKPSRLAEAPGFFNKLFGKGKRWIAIVALSLVVVVSVGVIWSNRRTIKNIESVQGNFDSHIRRQIIGDQGIIDKGIRTGWADVFDQEGDRFFASFAIPGVPAAVGSTTEDAIRRALDREVSGVEGRSIEARQILAIVAGIKRELRRFLTDGGTIAQYGRRLVQRQEQELSYYYQAKAELDRAIAEKRTRGEVEALIERRNASLRKIGVKLIVIPEGGENAPAK